MDTAQLAAREHENLIETWDRAASGIPNALVRRDRGIALVSVPLPVRQFNQVIVERDDADPDALTSAVEAMRERQAVYAVNLRAGIDDEWVPRVERLGLVPLSVEPWMPGMAAHPLPPPGSAPVPDGHEIRRVTDMTGIRDHIAAAAAGFGMPAEWLDMMMGEHLLADPRATIYVGHTDGAPVSAGMGYRTGHTIGVYNIATVEAARGRGYGAAMTMRVVDDARDAGCDVAILQSTVMGYPIYARLGFRTVIEYRAWIDPEPQP
jgi:GNAT superfamily N-acetyltransferase